MNGIREVELSVPIPRSRRLEVERDNQSIPLTQPLVEFTNGRRDRQFPTSGYPQHFGHLKHGSGQSLHRPSVVQQRSFKFPIIIIRRIHKRNIILRTVLFLVVMSLRG